MGLSQRKSRNWPKLLLFTVFLVVFLNAGMAHAVHYIQVKPMSQVVSAEVHDVMRSDVWRVPLITWGGDEATIFANGNSRKTAKNSIFAKEGLDIELFREDDFKKQVEMYMRGETPFLRGTMGMINLALDVISRDPRTVSVVIYQMTWSSGGDALVVKHDIKTVKDLCGRSIALQAYGPHVDYMTRVVTDACGSLDNVNLKWTKDLVGLEGDTPGAAFHDDIDLGVGAAFMISPDAGPLTTVPIVNGKPLEGAENHVPGSRILFSTATANHVIPDVYVVRMDFFKSHRDEVMKFVHGLMRAQESLATLIASKASRNGEYKEAFTAFADILLDSKLAVSDVEGLYHDCTFVGYPGNVAFFGDPNNPRNFETLTNEIQNAYVAIGLLPKRTPLDYAKWDFNSLKVGLANVAGVKVPQFDTALQAKIAAERQQSIASGGDLGFSMEVRFQPRETTFSSEQYKDDFERIIHFASTYGGAMFTSEGNVDPQYYWINKEKGASELELTRILQKGKNDSEERARTVQDAWMAYARGRGVKLNESQFIAIGHGIMRPKSGRMCGGVGCRPQSADEWRSNMRVEFHANNVEAESTEFVAP